MPNKLVSLAAKYRARLDKQSEADLRRLISAYGLMSQRLKDKVDLLVLEIEKNPAANITKTTRYKDLEKALNEEFGKYNVYLETELERIANEARSQARLDAAVLISSALLVAGLSVKPKNIPQSTAPSKVLAPGSAAYKRLHELAPLQAETILRKLQDGINLGWGYEKLGREIVNDLGLSLSDALRWARTTQMEAYREQSHATMLESPGIIDGWTWWAQIDEATCDSCKENHGSFHSPEETLTELTAHVWNCRCVELPHVVGDDNPVTEEPIE